MELRDSGRTISFIARIIYQIPTIALSTLTMIAISRNLGPRGRGEVSQILLLAALGSCVLCTPIFLTIMNLRDSTEIKSYISRSLFLFDKNNLATIALIDTYLLFSNRTKSYGFSYSFIWYMDLLIVAYFVSSQIRDLFLRFHRNKIYGVDFAVQILISAPILLLLLSHSLSVLRAIQIFALAYAIIAFYLLSALKARVKEFKFANLVLRRSVNFQNPNSASVRTGFSKTGLLFQLVLSKDLLFGVVLLEKGNLGLMSALASFWVAIRFLRPSALVQTKVGRQERRKTQSKLRFMTFSMNASSVIYFQLFSIGVMGLLGYFLTPILMGSGFKPSVAMTMAGLSSEILLMKCLYDLSTTPDRSSQNLFAFTCTLQALIFGVLRIASFSVSITMIWFSSCIVYLAWLISNRVIFSRVRSQL